MNPVNRVVLSRREFKTPEELHKAVANQIMLLLESGYVIVASKEDEVGDGYAIDYSMVRNQDDWPKPFWLVKNEMIAAADVHIDNEVDNAKQIINTADKANKLVDNFLDGFKNNFNGGNNSGGYDA